MLGMDLSTLPIFKDNTEQTNTVLELEKRIRSFKGWKGRLLPKDLAIAGFRYTGIGDKVQCDSCELKLHKWRDDDNAVEAHKLYSPNCRFVKKWFTPRPDFIKGSQYELPAPQYPEYRHYQQRLDSFHGWVNSNAHQSPSKMASAGLYFFGFPDRVKCFQCGLGLRDWDDCDYPLDCHKEWSPSCPFINRDNVHDVVDHLQAKGQLDGEIKQDKIFNEMASVENGASSVVPSAIQTVAAATPAKCLSNTGNGTDINSSVAYKDINSKDIEWNSPMVQAVLEMGCSTELVQKAILEHREKNGRDFENAALLYMAIPDLI